MSEIIDVINSGLCNGCGNCAYLQPDVFSITMDETGKFSSSVNTNECKIDKSTETSCPFSNSSKNESALSEEIFPNTKVDPFIGAYINTYAGYINDSAKRKLSTSGGIIKFVASQLLHTGVVDNVIHVKQMDSSDQLFGYSISKTVSEVYNSGKSGYYPVSHSELLSVIKNNKGDYLFIGLPCMVKSIRLLCQEDEEISKRIKFTVALVCGHLKTANYARYFSEQVSCDNPIKNLDFRYKTASGGASDYSIRITDVIGKTYIEKTRKFRASNWQYNSFRYPCCNYCDDVFGETADLTVGDAWIAPYLAMNQGVSEIIVRNSLIDSILNKAMIAKELTLEPLSVSKIVRSQLGGVRDRREGLAYRLFIRRESGQWIPKKRVEPTSKIPKNRKKLYLLRLEAEARSNNYKSTSLLNFDSEMKAIFDEIDYHSKVNKYVAIIQKLIFIILNKNKVRK